MKRLHIVLAAAALLLTVLGFVFAAPETAADRITLCFAAAAAASQPVFIIFGGASSRLYRVKISAVGLIYLAAQLTASGFMLAAPVSPMLPLICGATLLLAALSGLLPQKQAEREELVIDIIEPDSDPTGTRFVSELTEMTDTISRATAERDCGIYTQMLYEQARFGEPSTDPSIRSLEREILSAVCDMRPDDTDEAISDKCRTVMALLEERAKEIRIRS